MPNISTAGDESVIIDGAGGLGDSGSLKLAAASGLRHRNQLRSWGATAFLPASTAFICFHQVQDGQEGDGQWKFLFVPQ